MQLPYNALLLSQQFMYSALGYASTGPCKHLSTGGLLVIYHTAFNKNSWCHYDIMSLYLQYLYHDLACQEINITV